jgi:hypothetical protein
MHMKDPLIIWDELKSASEIELRNEIFRQDLASHINELIIHDFPSLVQLLYRIDVSEMKLKELLREQPQEDAGLLIADLLIERQIKKIQTRQSFSSMDSDVDPELKW